MDHTRAERRLEWLETLCLLALAATSIAPLLIFPLFPTQDAPAHLDSANALNFTAAQSQSLIAAHVDATPGALTNHFAEPILRAAIGILRPEDAIRAVYLLYVLGFIAVMALALRLFGARAALAIALSAPLAFSLTTYAGFLNHMFANCLAMAALLLHLSWLEHGRASALIGVSAVLTLGCIAHVFPIAAAILFIMTASGLDALRSWGGARGFIGVLQRITPTALAISPATALILTYALTGAVGSGYFEHGFEQKLFDLATLTLAAFGDVTFGLSIALAIILTAAVVTASAAPGAPLRSVLAGTAALMLALYLGAPNWVGPVTVFNWRFAPLLVFFLSLLTIVSPITPRFRRVLLIAATFIGLGLAADRAGHIAGFNQAKSELRSLRAKLHAPSTLLYLDVTQTSPLSAYGARLGYRARRWQFDPYLHFHGYLTPGRDMLNLSNYQLQPALTYFRAKLRCPAPCQYPAVENIPFKLIAGDTASARTDMAALRAVIGRPIDHIVIHWGETPPAADLKQRMMTALGADYRTNAFAAESRFEWLTRTAP